MKLSKTDQVPGLSLVLVAVLSGCAGSQGSHRVWPREDPVIVGVPSSESTPRTQPQPLPPRGIADDPGAQPQRAEDVSGAAVTSLMRQARAALDEGRPEQAAASLERAMRIEPRNYFVWSMLGRAYLAQQNFEQADSVAAKSNSLARGNVYAELENWRTIAEARAGLGDSAGAAAAAQRARELEQWLRARP